MDENKLFPVMVDPLERRQRIRQTALNTLKSVFPIVSKKYVIEAKNMRVDESDPTPEDHKQAILQAKTLTEPLRADMVLKSTDGKTLQTAPNVTLLRVPFLTEHGSFLINGNPISVANQLRLRPGVYTRKRRDEGVEADFKIIKGNPFRMRMDPASGVFTMEYGSTVVPLYTALNAAGIGDDQIAKFWNRDLVRVNREAAGNFGKQVQKLYRVAVPDHMKDEEADATQEKKIDAVQRAWGRAVVDPKVTARTLGKAFSNLSPEVLLAASKKVLDVYKQDVDYDERDSMAYKHLKSVEDFIGERIGLDARNITRKAAFKLDRTPGKPDLLKMLPPSPFTRGVMTFLSTSALSENPTQINPLEVIDHSVRVTSLGEGGIGNERAVPVETRRLHPTHFGVLDPVRTPESSKAGIDLRLSMFAKRDEEGNLYVPVLDRKGNLSHKSVYELETTPVAFPDQKFSDAKIDVMHEGRIRSLQSRDVKYKLPAPPTLYSPTTNLVPFLDSTDGMRATMGAKFLTQALPLVDGEAPLVQTKFTPDETFEQTFGNMMAVRSPVSGVVAGIKNGQIIIKPRRAKHAADKTVVQFYRDFPLASKTYLDQNVLVKPGDEVKEGQVLADAAYAKNGVMSVGKNLRVAYMPFRGLNTNDAVAISESAAKKLTSAHMLKEGLDLDDDTVLGREKHKAHFGSVYARAMYDKLDDNGLIKPGSRVDKGDVLIAAVRKASLTPESAMLGRLHKSLVKPFRDASVTWSVDRPGTVVDVAKTGSKVRLTVKYDDPMEIGSKLCFTEEAEVLTSAGWKRIAAVTLDDWCYTANPANFNISLQQPTALHRYPEAEKLYEVMGQQIELRVTDNHRLLVRRRGKTKYELRPASEVCGTFVTHKKNGVWSEETPEFVELPGADIVVNGKGSTSSEQASKRLPAIRTLDWLTFLGIYLANGSTSFISRKGRNGAREYRVDIHSTRGVAHSISGDQREWVEKVIQRCGFRGVARPDRVCINSKQLAQYLQRFGHAVDKYVPDEVFSWGEDAAKALLTGLLGCDGSKAKNSITESYHTVSPKLADDVQRLCLHAGWSAVVHGPEWDGDPNHNPQYRVSVVTKKNEPGVYVSRNKKTRQTERLISSSEPVFGVSVPNETLYVRFNGKPVWTGNSNRYGGKGVVAAIVPDDQMPHGEDKKPIDLVWSSTGVISRVNPAQLLEVAAGKVAEKLGKPVVIENFAPRDNVKYVKSLLAEHGLKDTETVYDPQTRKRIPGVLVGPSYTLKLMKTIDTQYSARGIEDYDFNEQPTTGGEEGSKGIGKMEFNALLGHNARNILRDAAALKSQKNDEYWRAYQLGLPTPPLKSSFAYDKFGAMLMATGVKMDKSGHKIGLSPLTDKDILAMSSGEIKAPRFVRAKDLKPERGGLFDPALTGGPLGTRWSHITLAEPIVNPVFERPARTLLGMTGTEFNRVHSEKGGAELRKMLNAVDVKQRESEVLEKLKKTSPDKRDDLVKQLKYVRALKASGLKPGDAYVISNIPVMPPVFRPITPGKTGDLRIADANYLYQDAMKDNDLLGKAKDLPDELRRDARDNLYQSTAALFGLREATSPRAAARGVQGYLARIAGSSPKYGYFHSRVIRKQQDLSGRGAVVPDPSLDMNELGVPEDMGWKMYSPFIVRQLVTRGYQAVQAKKMIEDKHPAARDILFNEAKNRPVLINRAPTLHRFNVLAGYPRFIDGKAVRVPEMLAPLQNMDFDGDAVQLHVPVSHKAVEEAKGLTLSNMLLGDRTKRTLLVAPDQEAILGLYRATAPAQGKVHTFETEADARAAYNRGEIQLNTPVKIKKG